MSPEKVAKVEKNQGKLTTAQMLRCRVRYFVDGAVIGSRSFVEEVFASCRIAFALNAKLVPAE